MTQKLTSTKDRARDAATSLARPRAGQLVMFPTAKKPRGRPKKPPASPSTDDFDIVCLAIRGIAKGRTLQRAKEEARRRVSVDPRIRSNAGAITLFGRFLDALNYKEGRDWHSVAWYASDEQCARPVRAIERAFKALVDAGHLLRRRRARKHGWDISETTSPTLARAANALPQEPEAADGVMGTVRKFYRYRHKNLLVPSRKSEGTGKQFAGSRHENTQGPVIDDGLTSEVNLGKNLPENHGDVSARDNAPDDVLNFEVQEAAQPAADGCQRESTQGQSQLAHDKAAAGAGVRVGERPAQGDPMSGRVNPGTLRVDPRFDQTLPLRQRLRLIGKYRKPANVAEAETLVQMRRAAKGWSLEWCLDEYVGFAAGSENFEQPRDAHKAFLKFVQRKVTKPATGWVDLAISASGSKKTSATPRSCGRGQPNSMPNSPSSIATIRRKRRAPRIAGGFAGCRAGRPRRSARSRQGFSAELGERLMITPSEGRARVCPAEVSAIAQIVAAEAGFTVAEVIGDCRVPDIIRARSIAYLVARRWTGGSLAGIGRALGKDHTTVLSGSRRAELRIDTDLAYRELYDRVWRLLETIRQSDRPPSESAASTLAALRRLAATYEQRDRGIARAAKANRVSRELAMMPADVPFACVGPLTVRGGFIKLNDKFTAAMRAAHGDLECELA